VDLAVGSATDGQLERLRSPCCATTSANFPPYEAAPIVRQATLDAHPQLADALRRLAGRIRCRDAARERQVDGEHVSPADAARELLSGAERRRVNFRDASWNAPSAAC